MFGPSVGALQGMKMKRTPEATGKPAAVKPLRGADWRFRNPPLLCRRNTLRYRAYASSCRVHSGNRNGIRF
jgi:hypothetical protein